MSRKCLCLAVALRALEVALLAAVLVSETQSEAGDDVAITLGAAPTSDDRVIILTTLNSEAQTVDIINFDVAETVLYGPVDSPGFTSRSYAHCMAGNGSDTTFTVSMTGSPQSIVLVLVASGLEACASILDDSEGNDFSATTSQSLTTDLTTTQSGDLIVSSVRCTNACNFIPNGSYTQIADDLGSGGGQYLVVGGAGTYDPSSTTADAEDGFIFGLALKASGGGAATVKQMLLLGVGPR